MLIRGFTVVVMVLWDYTHRVGALGVTEDTAGSTREALDTLWAFTATLAAQS